MTGRPAEKRSRSTQQRLRALSLEMTREMMIAMKVENHKEELVKREASLKEVEEVVVDVVVLHSAEVEGVAASQGALGPHVSPLEEAALLIEADSLPVAVEGPHAEGRLVAEAGHAVAAEEEEEAPLSKDKGDEVKH